MLWHISVTVLIKCIETVSQRVVLILEKLYSEKSEFPQISMTAMIKIIQNRLIISCFYIIKRRRMMLRFVFSIFSICLCFSSLTRTPYLPDLWKILNFNFWCNRPYPLGFHHYSCPCDSGRRCLQSEKSRYSIAQNASFLEDCFQ